MNLDRLLVKAKVKYNGMHMFAGDWVKGYYVYDPMQDKHLVMSTETDEYDNILPFGQVEIDPETICQCSGLKDKDGVLIFEGDVCKIEGEYDVDDMWYDYKGVAEMKWEIGSYDFYVERGPMVSYLDCGTIEVIGNIHDSKGE